jgi:hypothetical protein
MQSKVLNLPSAGSLGRGSAAMRLTQNSKRDTWQEQCTKELLRCAADADRIRLWAQSKKVLETQQRIIIADVDFQQADLQGLDFSRCYIIRADFSKADLSRANFRLAIVKECQLTGAKIHGTDFSDADVSDTNFYKVDHDGTAKLNFASQLSDANRARPAFRQTVEEHRLIADLRSSATSAWVRLWNLATNFGTSIPRLMLISLVFNLVLGTAYYGLISYDSSLFKPMGHYSWLAMVALALQRFLNTSTEIEAGTIAITYVFILNSFFGYAVLGIVIALLSKKLVASLR